MVLPVLLEPCFPLLLFTLLFLRHIVVSSPLTDYGVATGELGAVFRLLGGNLIFENVGRLCYVLSGAGWPEFFS